MAKLLQMKLELLLENFSFISSNLRRFTILFKIVRLNMFSRGIHNFPEKEYFIRGNRCLAVLFLKMAVYLRFFLPFSWNLGILSICGYIKL